MRTAVLALQGAAFTGQLLTLLTDYFQISQLPDFLHFLQMTFVDFRVPQEFDELFLCLERACFCSQPRLTSALALLRRTSRPARLVGWLWH